ncbi:ParB/RepB/Spo0J family partition protein [Chitinasiproducens palmae]|uniref:Chromosome segregation protein Spo0J, contains ParB-like nuclease domain n=1 Tax=Chitinasiproducens palmae TaxID=1770053 RepID=A0A1H2PPM0_9BURK|nr:ParB N-terminal domain-containing protein [Chitinasiproducens palmae]SDV48682.1 Chromosome segregation protein Spo0J, contains ParB-like nuclease domain [Chitinasiproducens palmae]
MSNRPPSLALELLPPIVPGRMKEAIAQAGGKSADLWMVPPDQIHYDPLDNIRALDQEHVRHLADLMLANGYDRKHPIGCFVRKRDGRDIICVYAGQHRYHAAKLAIAEGADIRAIPVVIDAAKFVSRSSLIIAGVNGNKGASLTPLQLAAAVADLQREGLSSSAIAKQLCVTDQTLRDLEVLRAAPACVLEMVARGEVSATLAIEQIRQHGSDAAVAHLEAAVRKARSAGKARASAKHLPSIQTQDAKQQNPAAKPAPAVALLQSVATDPSFASLAAPLRQRIARFLETNAQ